MSENSKRPVSTDLTQNIEEMEFYFHDCADIKKKQMKLGRNQDTACYLTFIEVSVDMGTSALGETLKYLNGLTRDKSVVARRIVFHQAKRHVVHKGVG